MDYSEMANQLRATRLAEEAAKKKQEAKDSEQLKKTWEAKKLLFNQKTEELLPFFKQFEGHKTGNGTLEACTEIDNEQGLLKVKLKLASVGSSGLNLAQPGSVLFWAQYEQLVAGNSEGYRLAR